MFDMTEIIRKQKEISGLRMQILKLSLVCVQGLLCTKQEKNNPIMHQGHHFICGNKESAVLLKKMSLPIVCMVFCCVATSSFSLEISSSKHTVSVEKNINQILVLWIGMISWILLNFLHLSCVVFAPLAACAQFVSHISALSAVKTPAARCLLGACRRLA